MTQDEDIPTTHLTEDEIGPVARLNPYSPPGLSLFDEVVQYVLRIRSTIESKDAEARALLEEVTNLVAERDTLQQERDNLAALNEANKIDARELSERVKGLKAALDFGRRFVEAAFLAEDDTHVEPEWVEEFLARARQALKETEKAPT